MPVPLSTLITRLSSDVPARDNIPSPAQYNQAIQDAVADYSARNSIRKRAALSIVSGTASYPLPDDFLKVIKLESLLSPADNVMVTASGLIPLAANFKESHSLAGNQITFYPTPAYTASRHLWYAAAYILDQNNIYQSLTNDLASVIMLKAQAIALRLQANKAAQEAWQYAVGVEKVSKEKLSSTLAQQSKEAKQSYLAAVKNRIGPIAMQGEVR